MNSIFKPRLLLCLGFCLVWLEVLSAQSAGVPEAKYGVLDISQWRFEQQGPVELNGDWVWYWRQLLSPEQLPSADKSFAAVPSQWLQYEGVDQVEGFATFALTLLTPAEDLVYGLYIEGEGSAYRLWINNRPVASNGKVGIDAASTIPDKKSKTVFFHGRGESLEIVMQVANFNHQKGGFRNPLRLGLAEQIHQERRLASLIQSAVLSVLFIIAIYHFFLYAYRSQDRFSLYFALMCLLAGIRIGHTGENVLLPFIPDLGWVFALKVEYLTLFLVTPIYSLMMFHLYPKDIHRWFLFVCVAFAGMFSGYTLFSSTLAASYSITYYQNIILLEMLYCGFFILRIFQRRREGRYYVGLATLIGISALVVEVLFFKGYLPFGKVASFGMIGFVFVQALFIAARFSNSYRQAELLSAKIESKNLSLAESERKYRTIFEDSIDMIFVANIDGSLEDVSPASNNLLGYSPQQIVTAKNLNILGCDADRKRFTKLMLTDGEVQDFDVELFHKNGQIIRVLVNATARFADDGIINGFQGYVRDISDKVLAQEQRQRAERLELIATVDSLTKAFTRRYFYDVAQKEINRSQRHGSHLSVMLFDVDNFKKINDNYGHLGGDKVLLALAVLCQQHIRANDVLARFGGEEFIILMPDTSVDQAYHKAQQLRQLVDQDLVVKFKQQIIKISFSAGVATWQPDTQLEAVIEHADQALYQAKQAGRNQVIRWVA